MCGILCVLGLVEGAEKSRDSVLQRVKRLRHRGPDWGGVYCRGKNILAHERLAIVDPSSGAQPLYNMNKSVVLAVNGEIYNHKQLRAELKQPHEPFQTESDCEVILHLYQEQGPNFLRALNGIFAFVLYDESKDIFFVARDHIGIIPLYVGRGADGSVWISSELKALCDICVSFEEFPPGHYMMGDQEFRRWYQPIFWDEAYLPTTPVQLQLLRENFEAAVVRQLMSDVPYGVLLSGGLDSSLVSAIAARHARKRIEDNEKSEAWWPRLHSFSVGLKGSPDLAMARKVADFIGSVHHEFTFTVQEGIDALYDVIYHLETFDVTTIRASTPMYLMSRKIRALGVKMVLSGEGSDEIFGGYLYFHKAPNKEELHKETVRKLKMLNKYDCLRANKSTAAWGVEARVPFLDIDFLEYAMNIDPVDKLITKEHPIEKWILRKAFEGYLPEEILWRQKEQFSDGVGYSWIDSLKALAASKVSDEMFAAAKFRFPIGTPASKEAYFYRSIFEEHFPQQSAALCIPTGPSVACSTPTAILWDAAFQKMNDPSGRAVAGVHQQAYQPTDASASEAKQQ